MNSSRLFSSLYNANLSIGRVQTPTLAMIVERDYKVKNFVKEKYYVIELDCGNFVAFSEKIEDLETATKITDDCKGKSAKVTELKKEKKTVNPPKLYDLTTLQREANRQFSFSAQQTLDATQKLYEKKLVTYPRTDSQFITDDMVSSTTALVGDIYSKLGVSDYDVDVSKVANNKKVTDHHAILPTSESLKADLSALPENEQKILKLVTLKLLCAVAKPYIYEAVTAKIECSGHDFTAKGKSVISTGWKQIETQVKSALGMKVNNNDKNEDDKSLTVTEGQTFENPTCNTLEKWTSPPKHFTEDTLLSAMETAGNKDYELLEHGSDIEKKGIGTPATRASVIETLIRKGFISREKKLILSTDKGANLIKIAPESVKSAKLTAEWETVLQNIERGKADADSFMADIESLTRSLVSENATASSEHASSFSHTPQNAQVIGKCPKCGGDVIETLKAFSCGGGKGDCKFILWKSQFYKPNALSATQAKKLLEKGKTDKIKGFVSKKTSKSYDAFLVLKSDFSVGLEF